MTSALIECFSIAAVLIQLQKLFAGATLLHWDCYPLFMWNTQRVSGNPFFSLFLEKRKKDESPGQMVRVSVCKSSPAAAFAECAVWGLCIEKWCSKNFFGKHFPLFPYKAEIVKLFTPWSFFSPHFFFQKISYELISDFMWWNISDILSHGLKELNET